MMVVGVVCVTSFRSPEWVKGSGDDSDGRGFVRGTCGFLVGRTRVIVVTDL